MSRLAQRLELIVMLRYSIADPLVHGISIKV